MKQLTILGSGAAPGVPSLGRGWGVCDPQNPKNRRLRTSAYLEYDGGRLLIDTSPDLRLQLLANDIRYLDGVLYTHAHADHVHGIDDIREINRIIRQNLHFYAGEKTVRYIRHNFSYLLSKPNKVNDVVRLPSMVPNIIKANRPFDIKGLKIMPIKLLHHCPECLGYVFNDGEIVYIADFKVIAESGYKRILRRPKLLVLPLTTPYGQPAHAGLADVLAVIERINPEKAVINHMATECDYNQVMLETPENVVPAYDNMKIVIED